MTLVKNYDINLDLTLPNKPLFLRVCSMSLLKILWEKEKLLVTSNFSFSHIFFYHFGELSAIFIKLKDCPLQTLSVWKEPQKKIVLEGVNELFLNNGCYRIFRHENSE